jgi:Di-haem oxidoreductase, putative peroxidase
MPGDRANSTPNFSSMAKDSAPMEQTAAVLIPPAFGLAGVNLHTWTGAWGTVTYWNAFVANLEMHGNGTFFDPRLDDPVQFPVAAKAGSGHLHASPDLITSKLAALQFYQLAIPAPRPARGSFDQAEAQSGKALFNGKAQCSSCHIPPLMTEPGWNLHAPAEVCVDDFEANRAPTIAIGPLRWADYGLTRRVAFTTMAASQL